MMLGGNINATLKEAFYQVWNLAWAIEKLSSRDIVSSL